jgi:spore germination protein KC
MGARSGGGRGLKYVLSLLPLLLLTGCWSSVELNDRAFVRMIVLDKANSGIELSLDLPLPNRLIPGSAGGTGESAGKPYTYMSKTGSDISDAYRKLQSDLSRQISFGQTRAIVIGRRLAEEGVAPILDFLAREPTLHMNAYIFVTSGRAREIESIAAILERFPTDILVAYSNSHVTVDTTLKDFLAVRGGDIIVPMLQFGKEIIQSEKEKEQNWMGTNGAAIFREARMVGALNVKEMRGGLWILGKLKESEISVPSPTDGKHISFMIQRPHTRTTPSIREGQVEIHIQCKAEAELLSSSSDVNLMEPQQLLKLEQSLNKEVRKRMASAFAKTKAANSDPFVFGSYIDWYYPKKWKSLMPHWRDFYSNDLKLETHVDIAIKRLGTQRRTVRPTGLQTEAKQ